MLKTVGDVLREIAELEQRYKVMSDMADKMYSDNETAKFIFEKTGVDTKIIRDVALKLVSRKYDLEEQLKAIEVNIK